MPRILKREAARRDLVEIWVWYAENAGIDTADRFLASAQATLSLLASRPQGGAPARFAEPGLQGLRWFPVRPDFEKILIFYFPLRGGIDLVRVLHASRDLERLIAEDFFG
jgi:toxin ParE1/3/4